MFRRKKTARREAVQDGPPDAEEAAEETQPAGTRKPLSMLDRWARDDAMGGAFTITKKDGRRFKM